VTNAGNAIALNKDIIVLFNAVCGAHDVGRPTYQNSHPVDSQPLNTTFTAFGC
jgi:hypothetical protein